MKRKQPSSIYVQPHRLFRAVAALTLSTPFLAAQTPMSVGAKPDSVTCKETDVNAMFLVPKFSFSGAVIGGSQRQETVKGEALGLLNWTVSTPHDSRCSVSHQRTVIDLIPSYQETKKGGSSPTFIRNYGADVRHEVFLHSSDTFAYLDATLYHNNSLGMYLQQSYSGGFGVARGAFEADADMRFVGEHFYSPGINASLVGLGLSGLVDIPLTKKRAGVILPSSGGSVAPPKAPPARPTLTLRERIVPVLNQSKAWYSNSVAALNIPFNDKWSFTVEAFDNYLRNAPYTFRRNYVQATAGITYSLTGQ